MHSGQTEASSRQTEESPRQTHKHIATVSLHASSCTSKHAVAVTDQADTLLFFVCFLLFPAGQQNVDGSNGMIQNADKSQSCHVQLWGLGLF